METGTIIYSVQVGQDLMGGRETLTAETKGRSSTALAAGNPGTLSTRIDDDEGELTLAEGHTITTGAVVDLFWSGGKRVGITVGTVVGNAVPLTDSGSGDVLPAEDTEVVCTLRSEIADGFDGDQLELLAVSASRRAYVEFQDEADQILHGVEIPAAGLWAWCARLSANPLAGESVDHIVASSGEASACDLVIQMLRDTV